jgi:hypothetical protein
MKMEKQYPKLSTITKPNVPTQAAAYYLDRQPQTLRNWACKKNGPLNPLYIAGRLAWPVKELRRVLAGG